MRRCPCPALLLLLLPGLLPAAVSFPPVRRGDVAATLTVAVLPPEGGPLLPEVLLTVTLTGPATLEVLPPRIEDARKGWKATRISSWVADGGRATVTSGVLLGQAAPGPAPIPDLAVRFRPHPDAPWEEVEWTEILARPREVLSPPPPAEPAPSSSWPAWLAAGLGLALLAALLVVWRMSRRSVRPAKTPEERALAQVELAARDAGAGPAWQATLLSEALRRYLEDRLDIPALRRTTTDVRATLDRAGALGEITPRVGSLLGQLDEVRFAPSAESPERVLELADQAARVVRDIAACLAGKDGAAAQAGTPGQEASA